MDSGNQTLVNKLEHDIANVLLDKLEYSDMSFERASLIAKFVLAHLPENLTDAQLETILPTLDSEFIEIAGVVHRYMNEYEKKYEMKITEDVQTLMKSGKLDEASQLMKAYFHKKLPTQQ